jgi:hypothetical protein
LKRENPLRHVPPYNTLVLGLVEQHRKGEAMRTMRWLLTTVVTCWLMASACHAFYNPEQGRWLSRDPIGEEVGENLYASVANDPLRRIDPRGMSLWPFGNDRGVGKDGMV